MKNKTAPVLRCGWLPVGGLTLWCWLAGPVIADAAPTLGRLVYERLTAIQRQLADEAYPEAIRALQDLLTRQGLSTFERAVLHETLGYAHSQRGDYAQAATAFAAALQYPDLPTDRLANNLYNRAQMEFASEQPEAAAQSLKRYLSLVATPDDEARLLLCKTYLVLERWSEALAAIRPLLADHPHPKTEWYRLQLAAQWELKEYAAAAATLRVLLRRDPEQPAYWQELVAVYTQAGAQSKAVAILELMRQRGLLTEARDIEDLALRYLHIDRPYRAAQRLTEALNTGRLPRTSDTLERLAQAWLAARESERARDVLTQAAPLAANGELYLQLAQLEYVREAWSATESAARAAIRQGGLKHPGQAYLLLGIAGWQQGQSTTAREALTQAARYPQTQRTAQSWLAAVNAQ